jgi:hypothetical protein
VARLSTGVRILTSGAADDAVNYESVQFRDRYPLRSNVPRCGRLWLQPSAGDAHQTARRILLAVQDDSELGWAMRWADEMEAQ